MSYNIRFTERFEEDLGRHRKAGAIHLVRKIETLVAELEQHPRTGIGKPEALRYKGENHWSRRIDQRHRLVYEIQDNELIVIAISAYGHYAGK